MKEELSEQEKMVYDSFEDPDVGTQPQYKWDDELQREILAMMLKDRHFLIQSIDLVQPYYFTNEVHQLIAKILRSIPGNSLNGVLCPLKVAWIVAH